MFIIRNWFEICIFVIPSAVSWRGLGRSPNGLRRGGAPSGLQKGEDLCGIPKGEALGGVWGGAPADFQRAAPFG